MRTDFFSIRLALIVMLLLICCVGCGIIPKKFGPFPEKQVFLMDGEGRLLKPIGNAYNQTRFTSLKSIGEEIPYEEERGYLNIAAQDIAEQLRVGKDVVVYFHGGMNTKIDSIKRSHRLMNLSNNKGDNTPHFVLFNWQSSLRSSYRDRLFSIREGMKYHRDRGGLYEWYNNIVGVSYFFSDLLAGVARAPVTLERQFVTFISNSSLVDLPSDIDEAFGDQEESNGSELPFNLKKLPEQVKAGQAETESRKNTLRDFRRTVPSTLTGPFRVVTTPIVDAFGVHAWDVMQRRTTLLFHRERFDSLKASKGEVPWEFGPLNKELGPLYKFGEELTMPFMNGKNFKKGKLILVGHSMGAILSAEFLRLFPGIPFDHIVFMGAACPIRDLDEKVFPYLAHPKNREAKFYNLVLHPLAETRESNLFGIGPVGSLLVWIDQWFEKPDSIIDRTSGRFTNIGFTQHFLGNSMGRFGKDAGVSERVVFKVFPYSKGSNPNAPMTHGSFDDFRFWEKRFWERPEDPTEGYERW
ncbi:MAG: hypothetical protein D3917_01580 [Candidatus Electrothrix sp. AX5]|nr:hypothetical protein [Candidatus Electrothrix sp. AX5]